MKKIKLLLLLTMMYLSSFGQVNGKFQYLNDTRLYLLIQNQTQYSFSAIGAVYRDGTCYNSEALQFQPGSAFILGPSTPWRWQWQSGDTYVITYPNGSSSVWKCTINDNQGSMNPSFKKSYSDGHEGKKCSVRKNGVYCNCSGCYGSNRNPKYCYRCGHECEDHNGH